MCGRSSFQVRLPQKNHSIVKGIIAMIGHITQTYIDHQKKSDAHTLLPYRILTISFIISLSLQVDLTGGREINLRYFTADICILRVSATIICNHLKMLITCQKIMSSSMDIISLEGNAPLSLSNCPIAFHQMLPLQGPPRGS